MRTTGASRYSPDRAPRRKPGRSALMSYRRHKGRSYVLDERGKATRHHRAVWGSIKGKAGGSL